MNFALRSMGLALLLLPRLVQANPVRDEVVMEFRNLVRITAQDRDCPDPDGLVGFLARFGLDLLERDHRLGIIENFDVFGPLLLEAQRPGRPFHYDVQSLCRRWAEGSMRTAVVDNLHDWLTAPIDSLEQPGSTWIEWSVDQERAATDRQRAKAAELLVEWNDRAAAPLIDALLRRSDLDEVARRYLSAARGRLDDPCHARLLHADDAGMLTVCVKREDILGIRGAGDQRDFSEEEIDAFCELLGASSLAPSSEGPGGWQAFEIRTRKGIEGTFRPIGTDRLLWRDDATQEIFHEITLENPALHDWLESMAP